MGNVGYEGSRKTWEAWERHITPGGVVVFGDSRSSAAHELEYLGSVKYTREVILTDPRYELIDTADTLTGPPQIRPVQVPRTGRP